jgi:hypothetical protein
VPPPQSVRRWTDWTTGERRLFAAILAVEIVLVLWLLLHGGRDWLVGAVIAALGVLYIYDLAVERRHRSPDA